MSVRRAGPAVGRVARKGPPSETTDLQADLLAESNLAPRLTLEPRSWPVHWPWQQSGTQANSGAEELACVLAGNSPGNSLAPRLALEPRSWPVYRPWQQSGTQASPGAEELACTLALATVWHPG
ncbi:hypothetical protein Bbelb_097760 [Branchiostoma belcheri]|nr:hypothetical protein Bbelb_097760 [Branchiostoma belcheri]